MGFDLIQDMMRSKNIDLKIQWKFKEYFVDINPSIILFTMLNINWNFVQKESGLSEIHVCV